MFVWTLSLLEVVHATPSLQNTTDSTNFVAFRHVTVVDGLKRPSSGIYESCDTFVLRCSILYANCQQYSGVTKLASIYLGDCLMNHDGEVVVCFNVPESSCNLTLLTFASSQKGESLKIPAPSTRKNSIKTTKVTEEIAHSALLAPLLDALIRIHTLVHSIWVSYF